MSDFIQISDAHMQAVCRPGKGAKTCRYLGMGTQGVECLKHSQFRATLDRRAMLGLMSARGDNCPGWDHETGKIKNP